MPDEPQNPSEFEMWERSRKLQMEMIGAIADAEKKHAEALVDEAKAANLNAATAIVNQIREHLRYTLQILKQREYKIDAELAQIHSHVPWIGVLKEARKVTPQSAASAWTAFSWFITNAPTGSWSAAYAAPYEPAEGDWQQTTVKQPDAPKAKTVGGMVQWCRTTFSLPAAGSPFHIAFLAVLNKVESAEDTRVAELEAWRSKVHDIEHADITPLKEILGVTIK